jgi:5-methylcytosine-specific restriction protein A
MPMTPPHRCTVCRKLVAGRCACRPAWSRSTRPPERIRGRRLQQLRLDLFQRQPLCVLCLAKTPQVIRVAVIRDHVQNLAAGGRDDDANVQGICDACHTEKTQREANRGRQAMR